MREYIQFHIEGDADLRKGFWTLISKKLKKPFNINMGRDRDNTVKQYNKDVAVKKYLVIDLENHPSNRETEIIKLSLQKHTEGTCFMVQKMEAWFISQADTLFDADFAKKLKAGNAEHIEDPDKKIAYHYYSHFNKKYNKVKEGVRMLRSLDIAKLEKDFPDVKNLVEELQKA